MLLFIQHGVLVMIAADGLFSKPEFLLTPGWWLMAVMVAAYAVLIFFWPVRRSFVIPYLAAELALMMGLNYMDTVYTLLGFFISGHAAMLLPLRPAMGLIAMMVVGNGAIMFHHYGWEEWLFESISPAFGFFAFGYINRMRREADEANDEAQRLLSELREVNQKLEAYAAQVQELAAVEERNRLARDLHDSVKQQAFAVSARLAAARSTIHVDPLAAEGHLLKGEQTMDEIRRELSQLIHELRPVALQDKGLPAALREWGTGWSQGCGIALDVRVQGERSLSLQTEQALFRIAQEALSNAARHSQAKHAGVCLEYGPGRLTLTIQDDGAGFDPSTSGEGIGLQSMRERAERLPDGSFHITSLPGEGTLVKVTCTA